MYIMDIVIETPKGSNEKYNWNPGRKIFELNKLLPPGMVFPFDFGFIPETRGQDNDPLDALLVAEFSCFPGCSVESRLVGCITGQQKEKEGNWIRNDRFLFVPVSSIVFSDVEKPAAFSRKLLKGITTFLMLYNKEKNYEVLKVISPEQASKLVKAAYHA